MAIYSFRNIDRTNLRKYINTGRRMDDADYGLLPIALETDGVDKTSDIDTCKPSPGELSNALAEKEELRLLEETLYADSGCRCPIPGSSDYIRLLRAIFLNWKATRQQSESYEPNIPYARRVFSIGFGEDAGDNCVGHAGHLEI